MGLDATVWCNCIETGKLKTPHPFPELLIVDKSGRPDINSDDIEKEMAHDEWQSSSSCEHDECMLAGHYLGNISLVAGLRDWVEKLSDDADVGYPVLRFGVIYSGSHCGDFLNIDDVENLKAEILQLKSRSFSVLETEEVQYLQEFLEQMDELIEASLLVNKPIAF